MNAKKRLSVNQERSVAKDLKAKLTPASGALWGAKGDVRSAKFLVECKATEANYYSLSKRVWLKIAEEALKDGLRTPLMNIQVKGRMWAVLDLNDFNELDTNTDDEEIVPVVVRNDSFRLHFNTDDKVVYQCEWGGKTVFLLVIEWDEFLSRMEKNNYELKY